MKYYYCYNVKEKYWVYDRYSNQIAEVDEPSFNIFNSYKDHEFELKKTITFLEKLHENKIIANKLNDILKYQKENNAFIPFELKKSIIPYTDEQLFEKYNNEVSHIIYNITDNCNFRCRYCKFSGIYGGVKTLQNKSISYKVIDQSFNLIKKYYKGNKTLLIGFYGGEPLLEFDKIKYIINTLKKSYKDIRFSISTNGVLLNKEIIRFFNTNNVFIKISIDGPENIHDRYRILKNGNGSYKIIMKKIEMIKEVNKKYFNEHVGFLVTLAPPYKIPEIIKFLEKHSSDNAPIIFSYVDPYDTTFFKQFEMNIINKEKEEQLKALLNEYLIRKENNDNSKKTKLLDDLFSRDFIAIEERNVFTLQSSSVFPKAACLPGLDRLYISVDGKLGMCEKVGESLIIGDIENGFDYNKIKKITNDFCKIVDDLCLDCWAYRLCQTCYNSALKNGRLDIERKKEECEKKKRNISRVLKLYTELKIKNPEVFKKKSEIELSEYPV